MKKLYYKLKCALFGRPSKKYVLDRSYVWLYETPDKRKVELFRVRAIRDVPNYYVRYGTVDAAEPGDLGGWVESEYNLSQEGGCWIYPNVVVYGKARVTGDALVGRAGDVEGMVVICGEAHVGGEASVGNAPKVDMTIRDHAVIDGEAEVVDVDLVCGHAHVYGEAKVNKGLCIGGKAIVHGHSTIRSFKSIGENANIAGSTQVDGLVEIRGDACLLGDARIKGNVLLTDGLVNDASDLIVINGLRFGSEEPVSGVYYCRDNLFSVPCWKNGEVVDLDRADEVKEEMRSVLGEEAANLFAKVVDVCSPHKKASEGERVITRKFLRLLENAKLEEIILSNEKGN